MAENNKSENSLIRFSTLSSSDSFSNSSVISVILLIVMDMSLVVKNWIYIYIDKNYTY